jgi:hypothetical protein
MRFRVGSVLVTGSGGTGESAGDTPWTRCREVGEEDRVTRTGRIANGKHAVFSCASVIWNDPVSCSMLLQAKEP